MSRLSAVAFAVGLAMAFLGEAQAQISYITPGSFYAQDFDSLPNAPENTSLQATIPWVDNSTSSASQTSLPGWYLYHPTTQTEGGMNGHQRFRITAGTQNTGAFYSFGTSGSTDRALGDIGSLTLAAAVDGVDIYIGLRLRNDTGQTLDSFTISYNGEQWRDGGNATPVAQSMIFAWSTTATGITNGSGPFTTEAALGYDSPVFTTTAGPVDGNNAGRVELGPVTVTGVSWAPGTDLWLRWNDPQNTGNDHGLAIDALRFSAPAIPEPTTCALLAVGALTLLGVARRKK